MALTTAVGLGVVAAVGVPWIVAGHQDVLGGVLEGELVPIPLGYGLELHWSWLIFCVVTLIAWAALAASRSK